MAIANMTFAEKAGQAPNDPAPILVVTLDLDNSYPTGGYADFKTSLLTAAIKAQVGTDITIVHIAQNNIVGTGLAATLVGYDRANDTLVCYDLAGAEHADTTDLSSATGLELVVFYK